MQSYNKNSNLAGAMASSTTEITKEGDGIRVNTQSTVKSSNFVFPDGKATEYTTMDGRKTMVRISRLRVTWSIFSLKIKYNHYGAYLHLRMFLELLI